MMNALSFATRRPLARTGRVPFFAWFQVAAERRRLASLDPERLADMGLTPDEARREAMRHFWDIPTGRF